LKEEEKMLKKRDFVGFTDGP